jgi:cell division protein FtsN
MAKRPYRDDFDQGEFSRDILDIIPERYDSDEDSHEARAGSRFRTIITLVVAVAAIGGIVVAGWKLVGGRHGLATGGGVPEIKAEDHPIKVRPDDRGGMQVPNQDKLVYKSMEQDGDGPSAPGPKTERLLAPPEEPHPPVRSSDSYAAATEAPPPPVSQAPPAVTATPIEQPKPVAPTPTPTPTPKLSDLPKLAEVPKPVAAVKAPEAKMPEPKAVEPPKPVVAAKPAPPPGEPKKAVALSSGDYVVQLGAVRSADEADKEWSRILHANGDQLSGLSPDVVQVDLPGKGTFWRVRAGSLSDQAARQLCQQLTARNQGCIVARK